MEFEEDKIRCAAKSKGQESLSFLEATGYDERS